MVTVLQPEAERYWSFVRVPGEGWQRARTGLNPLEVKFAKPYALFAMQA